MKLLVVLLLTVALGTSAHAQTAATTVNLPAAPDNTEVCFVINSSLTPPGASAAIGKVPQCVSLPDATVTAMLAFYGSICPPVVTGTSPNQTSTPCNVAQTLAFLATGIINGVQSNVANYVKQQAAAAAAAAQTAPTVTPLSSQ